MHARRHSVEAIIIRLGQIVGLAMARQVHANTAEPIAQPGDHGLPDPAIPGHAVQKNHRRAIAFVVETDAMSGAVLHANPEAPRKLPRHGSHFSFCASGARYWRAQHGGGKKRRQPAVESLTAL